MKKYYVTYFGQYSGANYYMEFDDKRESYIYAMCLQFVVRTRGWAYTNVKIRNRLSTNCKYLRELAIRKNVLYDYAKYDVECRANEVFL